MYTTIRRYTLGAGSLRELSDRIEAEFVPLLRSVPGFVSYQAMDAGREDDAPVLITISSFDSRAGAQESVTRAAAWVARNIAEFRLTPPIIMGGEVMIAQSAEK